MKKLMAHLKFMEEDFEFVITDDKTGVAYWAPMNYNFHLDCNFEDLMLFMYDDECVIYDHKTNEEVSRANMEDFNTGEEIFDDVLYIFTTVSDKRKNELSEPVLPKTFKAINNTFKNKTK